MCTIVKMMLAVFFLFYLDDGALIITQAGGRNGGERAGVCICMKRPEDEIPFYDNRILISHPEHTHEHIHL